MIEMIDMPSAQGIAPFAIGKYPVTVGQWTAIMGRPPVIQDPDLPDQFFYRFLRHSHSPDHPVVGVSWGEILQFLREIGDGYRLPTEAEWEYAARAGTTGDHFDQRWLDALAEWQSHEAEWDEEDRDYDLCFRLTRNFPSQPMHIENYAHAFGPVGTTGPNQFGLYDTHGQVWEVTSTEWDPARRSHVMRGGCHKMSAEFLTSSARAEFPEFSEPSTVVGFRLARSR